MVRVYSPAKLRPWSELTAKMVMGWFLGWRVAPLLINVLSISAPIPQPAGSCRVVVAGVLWQHPTHAQLQPPLSPTRKLVLQTLAAKDQKRKFSPKRKFLAGYPCGHPAKNFGQALQILQKQAFWNGHPARTSMKKLRSEKLQADFLVPTLCRADLG